MADPRNWAASALSNVLAKCLSIFFDNVEERIEISLWNGVIRLRNLLLKPSAIAALELPVPVHVDPEYCKCRQAVEAEIRHVENEERNKRRLVFSN